MIRTNGAASSGITSGFGLAIAKTIASRLIADSAEASTRPGPERPMNRSAPSRTSLGPPWIFSGLVVSANQRLIAGISSAS